MVFVFTSSFSLSILLGKDFLPQTSDFHPLFSLSAGVSYFSFRTRQSSDPANRVKSQDLNSDLVIPRLVLLLLCTIRLPVHCCVRAAAPAGTYREPR